MSLLLKPRYPHECKTQSLPIADHHAGPLASKLDPSSGTGMQQAELNLGPYAGSVTQKTLKGKKDEHDSQATSGNYCKHGRS